MSTEEIKAEINRVLDNLSDKTLQDLLGFLKDVQEKDESILDISVLRRILQEDEALLAKLAK